MSQLQIPQNPFLEEGYEQVNGIGHFYRIVGNREPFIFLHGGSAREMKLNVTVQDQPSNITCPTLIVQGKKDFIVPEAVGFANKLIKDSKLVFIEDSGHYPFMEAPANFFNALNSFVEEA